MKEIDEEIRFFEGEAKSAVFDASREMYERVVRLYKAVNEASKQENWERREFYSNKTVFNPSSKLLWDENGFDFFVRALTGENNDGAFQQKEPTDA